MLRASEYGSPTDSVGSPKRGQASAASRSGRPIHRVAGGATAADAEMAGVHDSDDAITETGSVSGSTVQGSIIDSRLGSATGRGRLLSFDGIALADLTNAPGVALTGFNAISTVLNHPTKRSNPIDPKSSRYPLLPISYSELPTARKSDHAAYLEQIRSEWDRFVRSQRLGARGKARLGDGDDLASEDGHQERAQDPMLDAPESSAAGTSRFSIDVASLRSEAQSPTRLTSRKRLPSLESVPKVYFQDGFSLSSPNVFGSVVEHSTASEKSNANARNEDGDAVTYEPGLNQILQEKLSYYSDVIEQHLIVEIGARSSSFFAALGNLQDLSAEATSCLKKVNILKEQLVAVDDRLAKKGLQLIAKQARRRELQRTSKAVQAVQELIERRSMVTLLVSHGEYEEALDLMESIRMLLRKRTSQANDHALETSDTDDIDFSKVPAVASIISGFANHHDHIASALQQDLLHILSKELTERVMPAEPVSQDVNMRDPKALRAHKSKSINLSLSIAAGKLSAKRSWGLCEENNETSEEIAKVLPRPPAPLNEIDELLRKRISSLSDELLRKRISSLIFGLVRTKGVERALAAYRDVAFSAIREAVKGHLVTAHAQLYSLLTRDEALTEEMLDADDAARRLRDMPHMDFLEMGHTFFQALLDYLGGINAQTRVILSLLHDMAHEGEQEPNSPSGTSTPNGDAKMGQYDMPEGVSHALPSAARELLHSAGELSHACVSRFISIRAKQHTSLTLRDFLAVFQLCWSFVLCSELICRRMIMGLRGTVLNQAKSFLVSFHHMRVAAAAKAVEEEKWDQVDVDAALQVEIERIVNSATEDQPEFIVSTEEDEDAVIISGLPSTDSSDKQQTNGSSSKEPHAEANGTVAGFKTLRIENRDFCVVKASLDMLSQLGEYIRVIVNLPLLTTEAMTRVVEFLKQFNSRTCQVVLGAGAMRSAGLKNITAKHLALASQSLSVVIALIPYIRETVRRHLTARQAVMLTEFDKLKRDYQEHQYEIHAKLVAIMSDRLSVHCKALRGINWNAEASGAEPKVNKYMLDLVKETSLLYKVLYRYLPTQTIDGVMSQVLAAIDKRTAAAFLSLEIRNEGARARMVFDIEHLNSKMGSLKSLTWSGLELAKVLKDKHVPPPQPVPESPMPGTPVSAGISYQPRIPSLRFGRNRGMATPPPAPPVSMIDGAVHDAVHSAQGSPPPRHDAPHSGVPESHANYGSSQINGTNLDLLPQTPGNGSAAPPGEGSSAAQAPAGEAPPTPAKDVGVASEGVVQPEAAPKNEPASRTSQEATLVYQDAETRRGSADSTARRSSESSALAVGDSTSAISTRDDGSTAAEQVPPETPITPATPGTPTTPINAQPDSPSGSGTGTPTRPSRMSLQQRLAEAARKRGLQAQQQQQQQQPQQQQQQASSQAPMSSPVGTAVPAGVISAAPSTSQPSENSAGRGASSEQVATDESLAGVVAGEKAAQAESRAEQAAATTQASTPASPSEPGRSQAEGPTQDRVHSSSAETSVPADSTEQEVVKAEEKPAQQDAVGSSIAGISSDAALRADPELADTEQGKEPKTTIAASLSQVDASDAPQPASQPKSVALAQHHEAPTDATVSQPASGAGEHQLESATGAGEGAATDSVEKGAEDAEDDSPAGGSVPSTSTDEAEAGNVVVNTDVAAGAKVDQEVKAA